MSHPLSLIRLLTTPALIMVNLQFLFGLLSLAIFHDGIALSFFEPALFFAIIALLIYLVSRKYVLKEISYRQAVLFVTLSWIICGIEASIPMRMIEHLSVTDSIFEAMSALTTTGATVLQHLDMQPISFLLYRQFLQWLGGLGVVVFVVAIVPMLNIGGMKIFLTETPGLAKDEKLAPRINHTARHLWAIYVGITLMCAISYFIAGMSPFDAIAHSLTTVSTGGFSTHDTSIGYFHSHRIEMISTLFMLLGTISFTLHFRFARNPHLSIYFRDEETRDYLLLIVGLGLLISLILVTRHIYSNVEEDFFQSIFHLVSFITSTGTEQEISPTGP